MELGSPSNHYPAYKPSGVKWLGHVPEHWDLVRMKYAVQINPETLAEDTDPEYIFDYMDINSVSTGYISTLPVRQVFGNAPSRARRVMRTGDTAISTVRTYLKAAYHLQRDWPDLIASTGFAVLRPPARIVPALLGHIVQSDAFVRQVVANSVGVAYPAISETKLGTLLLVLPPLPEQRAIVRYLDYVDRRIRRYVSAKRKLIALLDEERQAIVNRAVTRGLDPNVRLKPSGIEWLGDVPEHWDVLQFGHVIDLATGYPFNSEGFSFDADDIRLLRGINVSLGVLRWRDVARWPRADCNALDDYRMEIGDIVLGMDRPFIEGGVRVASVSENDVPALLLQRVARIRPRQELSSTFTSLLLTGKSFADYLKPLFTGISVPHVSPQQIKSYRIALPNMREQTEIVDHIMSVSRSIQLETDRARRQIELLQEYRTRLIADVVTGKLDVREAAAQLPDEPDDEEPIDEGRTLADDADGDLYDAGNFKEELAMEREVRA